MEFYLFAVCILISLGILDLIVGVSNDAVNFLTSSIGSRVAPYNVIMIIASMGILAGVTFSSGMMEVARKGIFHPQLFLMPELVTIFLAVMLTDVILLDLFNTFGLPTSTTVSIVFELLGAAVAISLIKIYGAGDGFEHLVEYINTGKALMIVLGILLSIVVAFFFGALSQFLARVFFTFDYIRQMKKCGGIYGGIALSIILYFILIKGSKGASFLAPEAIIWIRNHTWEILLAGFGAFSLIFQFLVMFTRINILKPIVLIGTFGLAMSFAANDLVNFIGVPLAGLSAYFAAAAEADPLTVTMTALQKPIRSATYQLLLSGVIMLITLWFSRKARTVTKTTTSLGRQDEGVERFSATTLSRVVVRLAYGQFDLIRKAIPIFLQRIIARRLNPAVERPNTAHDGSVPPFDLLRASVNLIVASAVVSFATSLKLPLSTTYVTFMVTMGTSLSDQAWGRESAVFRVTGVMTVVGGWFLTALMAFSVSHILAVIIFYLKLPAILALLAIGCFLIFKSYQVHFKREETEEAIEALSLESVTNGTEAIKVSFDQTGHFLRELCETLDQCFQAAFSEDRQRLSKANLQTNRIQRWTNIIIANIFKTLQILNTADIGNTQKYSRTIRTLQELAESHRDIIKRAHFHFANSLNGLLEVQKEELRELKTRITRLLWNTSIMLLQRKKVDCDYIANQNQKIRDLIFELDKNQIRRIQNDEFQINRSMLFYGFLVNCAKISDCTQELLKIFREAFIYPQEEPNDWKTSRLP